MADPIPVLVASADAGIRTQVRLTLGDERFVIHEAADSDESVHVIVGAKPQLIVLDRALPGAGAMALARTVHEHIGEGRPYVLMLVKRGEEMPADVPGVDATLSVPITSFALLRKVDTLLDTPA